jgi:hypothetical protein
MAAKAFVPNLASVKAIASCADVAFSIIYPLLPKNERRHAGGTLALTDKHGVPYFGFMVGRPPRRKRPGRWRRAFEKPQRAARLGHKTSRQSRNPKEDKWAGALWGDLGQVRGGFSGFPEDWDEIYLATVMVFAGLLSQAERLRQLKNNKTFQKHRKRPGRVALAGRASRRRR